MTKPSKTFRASERHDLEYDLCREIAETSGGWVSTSSLTGGDEIEVWHADTSYVISGEALVYFLSAVRDVHVSTILALNDFLDYVIKSENTPPSVFVRDALVGQARKLKQEKNLR